MTQVDVELLKLFSGLPIAVVTAWVTVRLALRRFAFRALVGDGKRIATQLCSLRCTK